MIMSASKIWDGQVVGVEVPVERSLDIDTPLDFEIAKFLLENNMCTKQILNDN